MTLKSLLSCALMAATTTWVSAQEVFVDGTLNGDGNIDWTVSFTPATPESSLAIEIAFETAGDFLVPADANEIISAPNFLETVDGSPVLSSGANPFDGSTNDGAVFFDDATSVIEGGPGGTVDGLYVALRSTNFGVGGPFSFPETALTFTTIGQTGELFFDGQIFQGDGSNPGVDFQGSVEVVGFGPVLGDANGDGAANTLDIEGFVLAILNPAQYAIDFADVNPANTDTNQDGVTNTLDIDSFVNVELFSPVVAQATAIPEPSAGILVCSVLIGLVGVRGARQS